MGILQDDGDSPGEDRDGDSPEDRVGDSPGVMEIPQKTVMGIPQSIHHQRRHGTNSGA